MYVCIRIRSNEQRYRDNATRAHQHIHALREWVGWIWVFSTPCNGVIQCHQVIHLWYGVIHTATLATSGRGHTTYLRGEVDLVLHCIAHCLLHSYTLPIDVWSVSGLSATTISYALHSSLWCSRYVVVAVQVHPLHTNRCICVHILCV